MDLKEAKVHFQRQLEEKVDDFIEEYGYNYVTPSPLEPPEMQIKRLRHEMLNKLTFKEYDTKAGLQIVQDYLPQRLSPDEWRKVQDELHHIGENALKYFNSEEAHDTGGSIRPTYQILGLSLETYEHCKNLLIEFVNEGDYKHVQDLSFFLISLFQDRIVPWLGAARSFDHFGDYHRAIEVYEKVHEMFPEDPLSYIFCSLSHVMLREPDEGKIQITKAEELLANNPKLKEVWRPTLEEIKKLVS